MSIDLRERVALERTLRYGSVRAAAVAGGISNTTWGRYEQGQVELSKLIRDGVARAFGWSRDWPENPPPPTLPAPSELEQLWEQVALLAEDQGRIAAALHEMGVEVVLAAVPRRRARG